MPVSIEEVKNLRDKTNLSVIQCKKALEAADGDLNKALVLLAEQGASIAEKKSERKANSGIIYSYIHSNSKIGVLLELACETDFVARNEEFKTLAHEIALQITSLAPTDVAELTEQDYIRDSSMKVTDLITAGISKVGENIKVRRFVRFSVGEETNITEE